MANSGWERGLTVRADGGQIEEPVLETDVGFVVESNEEHDPASGRVVLGSDQLVIKSGDRSVTVELESLTDIAPGYVPQAYRNVFDTSVAFSYARGNQRGIIVVEPIDITTRRFLVALLSAMLDGVPAAIAHPVERGEQETDEEPAVRDLYAHPYELEFGGTGDRGTGTTIKFSSLIHLDDRQMSYGGDRVSALTIRYLQLIGPPLTTEIRLVSDRQHTLVRRILQWEYNRRVREIKRLSLSADQEDVLRALQASHDSRDRALIAALDKTPEELAAILQTLKQEGLVRETGTKLKLTQTGHMLFTHERI
ncbi:CheF family chemotaxis protein [Halovenus sp. HT40]|uniref:CheF family chemotaxis protein n=1 Tax=Halovenus sp. HT40 TaxID=3126691 RepID=UPI00300F78E8